MVGIDSGFAHHLCPDRGARPACDPTPVAGWRVRPIVQGDGSRLTTEAPHATLSRPHPRLHLGSARQHDDRLRLDNAGCGTDTVACSRNRDDWSPQSVFDLASRTARFLRSKRPPNARADRVMMTRLSYVHFPALPLTGY